MKNVPAGESGFIEPIEVSKEYYEGIEKQLRTYNDTVD